MNQERLIAAEDITFRYQKDADRPALDHVSFHVSKGEWLAIVGHNGSGKSTLARALNGLILPDEGSIKVGGIKLTEETVWDVRKKVGMVFQNPDNQFVGTTVRDDVAFGLENNGVPREDMVERGGLGRSTGEHARISRSRAAPSLGRTKAACCDCGSACRPA
jgi:energy-coupling factor transport system ATP-binding protein